MDTEICPCDSEKPVIGWFYGPAGLLGYKAPDRAVPACEDCVQHYGLTVEPQRTDEWV